MTLLEALLLGVLQGLTEFLPISSSGHLKLCQALFGFKHLDQYLLFDLVCHLGTLCVIFTLFFRQILEALQSRTSFFQVLLGTLPLFPLVIIIKQIKAIYDAPELLGFFFLITALFLFLASRFGWKASEAHLERHRWRDSLLIGCAQAFAILPGVSRSGSTITAARLLGWDGESAVRFSVFLAIPAILGGTAYELLDQLKPDATPLAHIDPLNYLVGFLSSYLVGLGSLTLLIRVVVRDRLALFGWYCTALGIFTILYFNR